MMKYLTNFTVGICLIMLFSVTVASAADSGTFTGASKHVTKGEVKVVKTANGGVVVVLDTNFFHDGAPDPRVGFGKDGKYDDASDVGILRSNTGLQAYVVPKVIDVSKYNEVYIWCRKYAVPLGVAKLNK